MVERDRRVLDLLRRNVEDLALEDRATLLQGDALEKRNWGEKGAQYDLVFFDSPYPMLDIGKTRHAILSALETLVSERLARKGLVVFHAPKEKIQEVEFSEAVVSTLREYGTNAIFFLERK